MVARVSDFQVSTFHSGSRNLKAFLVFISVSQGNTGNCIDIDICDRGAWNCTEFLFVLCEIFVVNCLDGLPCDCDSCPDERADDETDEAHEGRGSLFQKCSNVGG